MATVDAGPAQLKYGGELVTLSATITGTTTSAGPWSQVSGPTVTLTTINSTTSSFTAELTNVTDVVRVFTYPIVYSGGSASASVTVTVPGAMVRTAVGGAWVAGQVYTA